MFIDPELVCYIEKNYGYNIDVDKIVENCGIWCTADAIRADWEDFEATLEDIISDTYFIVEDNKMLFCSVNNILEDIDMFITGGINEIYIKEGD